jgi:hypothetical protein
MLWSMPHNNTQTLCLTEEFHISSLSAVDKEIQSEESFYWPRTEVERELQWFKLSHANQPNTRSLKR